MRRGKKRGNESVWARAAVLAGAMLLGLVLLHSWFHSICECAATVPNDSFALPVQSASGKGDGPESEKAAEPKLVCLTFDDGPSCHTEEVLSILREQSVPATFFVTAQAGNLPYLPLLKTAVEEGHQIALHSASHEYSKIYASTADFWLDIKALRTALAPYVEVDSLHWLRFPGGSTNTVSHKYGGSGIMKQLISQAGEKGYEWIDWNVCAEDATAAHPNADRILRNIQRDAKGQAVCVVLLHDTKATAQTVKALPAIIEWFREEGYTFCTVEQMFELRDGA